MTPARPPGPPARLFSGHFREFYSDLLGFLTRCAREYGDVSSFRLGHRRAILANHPDLIEQVLVKHNKNFVKPFPFRFTRAVLGNGLLTSEGTFWLRQRRLAAGAFQAERIAGYGSDMVGSTQRMLSGWQDGQTRDIHADMMQVTLDIVARTLFGADVTEQSGDIGDSLLLVLRSFSTNFRRMVPLPSWIPTRGNRRARAAVRGLNRVVQEIVDKRRREAVPRKDLLSMMLHARDEDDGSQMTDEQLADEARTFLLAGHETTAIALSWTFYLLATHPHIQQELAQELDRELDGRVPTVADIPRLKLAERIVQESMRLFPPAFVIGRAPVADFELGGYPVRAGTTIFMSQWVMHRDGRFFERPEAFEPQRWLPERVARRPKMSYFPFGGGPRVCIGNTFAMLEAVLVLATIAREWSMRLVPDQEIRMSPVLTLRPRYGIRVVLSRRTPAGRDPVPSDAAEVVS
ncbi:MAG: cytochrome P450 [Planctomycetota bacterium]|nr:MAG: cytochrome P450 [Planctomycetota bacterium]